MRTILLASLGLLAFPLAAAAQIPDDMGLCTAPLDPTGTCAPIIAGSSAGFGGIDVGPRAPAAPSPSITPGIGAGMPNMAANGASNNPGNGLSVNPTGTANGNGFAAPTPDSMPGLTPGSTPGLALNSPASQNMASGASQPGAIGSPTRSIP